MAASGYNTGFRANATRSYTTPADDWAVWHRQIDWLTKRLQGVIIESRDALELMRSGQSSQVLDYLDPPYLPETRNTVTVGGKNKCYRHEMSFSDHERFLDVALKSQSMIVLSGYSSQLYDDMLSGWERLTKKAPGDGRSERVEVLWLNPLASEARRRVGILGLLG